MKLITPCVIDEVSSIDDVEDKLPVYVYCTAPSLSEREKEG